MSAFVTSPKTALVYVILQEGWLDELGYMVVHEYHHLAWIKATGETFDDFTLLENLIMKGMAENFARDSSILNWP